MSNLMVKTINEVISSNLPTRHQISKMTINEKIQLEKDQNQIINSFKEKAIEQIIILKKRLDFALDLIDLYEREMDTKNEKKDNYQMVRGIPHIKPFGFGDSINTQKIKNIQSEMRILKKMTHKEDKTKKSLKEAKQPTQRRKRR